MRFTLSEKVTLAKFSQLENAQEPIPVTPGLISNDTISSEYEYHQGACVYE